ncbi:MAG TPA: hypothetical protein PKC18_19965, partial [Lacipirellulaceae bacterium]|nr:hypothetical protein [Lacipirellulaceae bacterium]
ARGESVDARADVLALGSTLAAILTGQPAFVGTTGLETIAKAAKADLADVRERLCHCGADAELITLTLRCLAANPEERFWDAREVASQVAAYRAGVEARLQQAETERARAETRAAEQAKRRRVVQWAGGLIAAVLLVGIAGTAWGLVEANQAREAEKRRADAEAAAKQEADEQRELARRNEAEARRQEEFAKAETANKDLALKAERIARQKAMTALRTLTDQAVENQLARGVTLTEENKAFLRTIIEQFEGFAAITGDDVESRAI